MGRKDASEHGKLLADYEESELANLSFDTIKRRSKFRRVLGGIVVGLGLVMLFSLAVLTSGPKSVTSIRPDARIGLADAAGLGLVKPRTKPLPRQPEATEPSPQTPANPIRSVPAEPTWEPQDLDWLQDSGVSGTHVMPYQQWPTESHHKRGFSLNPKRWLLGWAAKMLAHQFGMPRKIMRVKDKKKVSEMQMKWLAAQMHLSPANTAEPGLTKMQREVCFMLRIVDPRKCPKVYIDRSPPQSSKDKLLYSLPAFGTTPARVVVNHMLLSRLPMTGGKSERDGLRSLLGRELWSLSAHDTEPWWRPVLKASGGVWAAHMFDRNILGVLGFKRKEKGLMTKLFPWSDAAKALDKYQNDQRTRKEREDALKRIGIGVAIGATVFKFPDAIKGFKSKITSICADRIAALVAGDAVAAVRALAAVSGDKKQVSTRSHDILEWAQDQESRGYFHMAYQQRQDYSKLVAHEETVPEPRVIIETVPAEIPEPPLPYYWTYIAIAALIALPIALVVVRGRATLVHGALIATMGIAAVGMVSLTMDCVDTFLDLDLKALLASSWQVIALIVYSLVMLEAWWLNIFTGDRRMENYLEVLTSRLVEQAEVTAGLYQQCRGWASIAKQSLQQLNRELKGSWQSALLQISLWMTDLREEIGYRNEEGQTLWSRVDGRLQAALKEEVNRMDSARLSQDEAGLQKLAMWWLDGSRHSGQEGFGELTYRPQSKATRAARSGGPYNAIVGRDHSGGHVATSMADLQTQPERLVNKFPYNDFFVDRSGKAGFQGNFDDGMDDDSFAQEDQYFPGEKEGDKKTMYRKIHSWEEKLKHNHQRLEDLQRRMPLNLASTGPIQYWRAQFRGDADPEPFSAGRFFAKWRVAFVLLTAAVLATGNCILDATTLITGEGMEEVLWLDYVIVSLVGLFAVLNLFILLNYGQLHLRHKHQDFERHLSAATRDCEEIERQMRDRNMLGASPQMRCLYLKAQVFLHSVNFLRNFLYLTLCIKNEMHRQPDHARSEVVLFGLKLMEMMLAKTPADLSEDTCKVLEAVTKSTRSSLLEDSTPGKMRTVKLKQMVSDSQRRVLMLMRLYHFSSELSSDIQGRLEPLVLQYIRPIYVDRMMPKKVDGHIKIQLGDGRMLMGNPKDRREWAVAIPNVQ